jgi:hypothetical protein
MQKPPGGGPAPSHRSGWGVCFKSTALQPAEQDPIAPRVRPPCSEKAVNRMLMSAIIRQAPRLLDVSGALARRGARDPYDAAARAMASAWWLIGDELSRQVDVAKARFDPVGRFTDLAITFNTPG